MPKILTDAYRDATFYVPYSEDKREGVYVKPLTETAMGKMRDEAAKEGGADDKLSSAIFVRKLLQASIKDWVGFYDVKGEPLPCTSEVIKEICECDSEFTGGLMLRIRNVARIGELEEAKN